LGYLLLRLGELTQAEDYLRESLRYNPSLSETHYYLGRVLDKENKPAEAMKEYQIAVTTDPRSADACYSLAMLYRSQHRDQDAEQMFAEWKKRKAASDTGEALSARP
jgi:tetratricopeptide (TPR) repeat protein